MTILEGNKLIAEFMSSGVEEYELPIGKVYVSELSKINGRSIDEKFPFHSSWDWLMPVVGKINQIDNREYDVIIWRSDCHINNREELMFESSRLKQKDTLIGVVWGCIILFIQWYNSQSKTDNNDTHARND